MQTNDDNRPPDTENDLKLLYGTEYEKIFDKENVPPINGASKDQETTNKTTDKIQNIEKEQIFAKNPTSSTSNLDQNTGGEQVKAEKVSLPSLFIFTSFIFLYLSCYFSSKIKKCISYAMHFLIIKFIIKKCAAYDMHFLII